MMFTLAQLAELYHAPCTDYHYWSSESCYNRRMRTVLVFTALLLMMAGCETYATPTAPPPSLIDPNAPALPTRTPLPPTAPPATIAPSPTPQPTAEPATQ
jgi:hypothetical protein